MCKGTPVERGAMLVYFAGAHLSKGSRLRRRGSLVFIRARSWTTGTHTPLHDPNPRKQCSLTPLKPFAVRERAPGLAVGDACWPCTGANLDGGSNIKFPLLMFITSHCGPRHLPFFLAGLRLTRIKFGGRNGSMYSLASASLGTGEKVQGTLS